MKKYIQPTVGVVEMQATESLLTLSLQSNAADNSTVLTNKKGAWDSDNWNASEEE